MNASPLLMIWTLVTVSVEKVVYAPKKPIAVNAQISGPQPDRCDEIAAIRPSRKDPEIFAANVPITVGPMMD